MKMWFYINLNALGLYKFSAVLFIFYVITGCAAKEGKWFVQEFYRAPVARKKVFKRVLNQKDAYVWL